MKKRAFVFLIADFDAFDIRLLLSVATTCGQHYRRTDEQDLDQTSHKHRLAGEEITVNQQDAGIILRLKDGFKNIISSIGILSISANIPPS